MVKAKTDKPTKKTAPKAAGKTSKQAAPISEEPVQGATTTAGLPAYEREWRAFEESEECRLASNIIRDLSITEVIINTYSSSAFCGVQYPVTIQLGECEYAVSKLEFVQLQSRDKDCTCLVGERERFCYYTDIFTDGRSYLCNSKALANMFLNHPEIYIQRGNNESISDRFTPDLSNIRFIRSLCLASRVDEYRYDGNGLQPPKMPDDEMRPWCVTTPYSAMQGYEFIDPIDHPGFCEEGAGITYDPLKLYAERRMEYLEAKRNPEAAAAKEKLQQEELLTRFGEIFHERKLKEAQSNAEATPPAPTDTPPAYDHDEEMQKAHANAHDEGMRQIQAMRNEQHPAAADADFEPTPEPLKTPKGNVVPDDVVKYFNTPRSAGGSRKDAMPNAVKDWLVRNHQDYCIAYQNIDLDHPTKLSTNFKQHGLQVTKAHIQTVERITKAAMESGKLKQKKLP